MDGLSFQPSLTYHHSKKSRFKYCPGKGVEGWKLNENMLRRRRKGGGGLQDEGSGMVESGECELGLTS